MKTKRGEDVTAVFLTSIGASKVAVVREVSAATGLDLMSAKSLVDPIDTPGGGTGKGQAILSDVPKSRARDIKTRLEAVGATVALAQWKCRTCGHYQLVSGAWDAVHPTCLSCYSRDMIDLGTATS